MVHKTVFFYLILQSLVFVSIDTKPFPGFTGGTKKNNNLKTDVFTNTKSKNITTTATTPSTTTITEPDQLLIIIVDATTTRPLSRCCRSGLDAGNRGYICLAYPNFVQIRYHLTHPFKMKFDPYEKKHVQLELARKIERCARHPGMKRQYEECCERAQKRLIEDENKKEQLIKECQGRKEPNCNRFHYKDG